MERSPKAASYTTLIEKDQYAIWHPFSKVYKKEVKLPITHAKGIYLFDAENTAYIDAISSWWVNLHGHSHPYIVQKIHEQLHTLDHVIFADCTHPQAIHLSNRLLKFLPGPMDKIFFSDNGSTAIEAAIKIALQYWYNKNDLTKTTIVCFENSYHGDTFGAMSSAGKNLFNKPFWNHMFQVKQISVPYTDRDKNTSYKQLQHLIKQNTIACFIFEPLLLGACAGMKSYSKEALNSLIGLCKQHSIITIADEVLTGFGRLGPLFASEHLKIAPDIICLSKGITGGTLPLGVTAIQKWIVDAFTSPNSKKMFLHGHSYTGNPIACAAANASFDLLIKNSCYRKRQVINLLHKEFCRKWDLLKAIQLEAIGTILRVEYLLDKASYFHTIGQHLKQFFFKRNILIRPLGNVLYIMPPYCIKKNELLYIYKTIEETFEGFV